MRPRATFTLCAILVLSFSVRIPVIEANDKAGSENKSTAVFAGKKLQDDLKIEARKGEAVKLRANQLRRKNKAVAKAMKDLESRGLTPAFESGVSIVAISESGRLQKTAAQETTIIDGDYELTFISYNNGNNATWEGTVYYRNPVGESVYTTLLDISSSASVLVLRERCYLNTTDGSTQLRPVGKDAGPRSPGLSSSSYKTNHSTASVPQIGRLKEFVDCAVGGCAGVLVRCLSQGVNWPMCFVAGCMPIVMGCAESHL